MRKADQIIGRETELAAVGAFLDALGSGPSALILEGEPGIGKSTLWRYGETLCRQRSCHVLTSRPAQAEQRLSYAGITDLLLPVVDVFDEIPAPQRRALDVALLRADAEGAPPDRRAVTAAVRSVLGALARSAPVVVAIDDLQWLDRPTAFVLDYCFRRLDGAPVSLLASIRAENGTVNLPFDIDEQIPDEVVRRVRVGPMSVAALHEIIRAKASRSLPRPTLVQVHKATSGNPFFALEIARSLFQSGVSLKAGDRLPVPSRIHDLVTDRISRLPALTRRALCVMAADPRPSIEMLRSVIGDEASSALERARLNGLIDIDPDDGALEFTHPLFSAAVYASTPKRERLELHSRLAEVVDSIEGRARHLALGAEAPDDHVAEILDEAARAADRRGAPTTAAELAEHALRLTRDAHERFYDRSVSAAEYHFHAGDLAHARELLERVVDVTSAAPVQASGLLLLAEVLFDDHQTSEAAAVLERALRETSDSSQLARIESYLAFERGNAGDFPGCAPHARAALDHAERAGDRNMIAEATAVVALVDCVLGHGVDRDAVERALALEDMDQNHHGWLRPSLLVPFVEILSDRLPEAKDVMARLYDRTVERGRDNERSYQLGTLVTTSCWLGLIDEVEPHVTEALLLARAEGGPARGAALYSSGLIAALRGRVEEAQRDLTDALQLLQGNLAAFQQWTLSALGFLYISTGKHKAAYDLLSPMSEVVLGSGVGEPRVWTFVPDGIEAMIALGRSDEAEPLISYLQERGDALDRVWALGAAGRCRALQLSSIGDMDGALGKIDDAIASYERTHLPIDLARALLVKGQIHRRRKERKAARTALEQALDMFDAMGMPLWSAQAHADLDRLGARSTRPFELTPTEERVARLAAAGMTNREVAQEIFVSPKTVEANLTRIYRKLGIGTRAELGARMHDRQSVSTGSLASEAAGTAGR